MTDLMSRTIAEMIEAPRVGDILRCVKYARENNSLTYEVEVIKVGKNGFVTFTMTRVTVCNGYESTQVDTHRRRPLDRWQATNFIGFTA